jgi:hypothetical protein
MRQQYRETDMVYDGDGSRLGYAADGALKRRPVTISVRQGIGLVTAAILLLGAWAWVTRWECWTADPVGRRMGIIALCHNRWERHPHLYWVTRSGWLDPPQR